MFERIAALQMLNVCRLNFLALAVTLNYPSYITLLPMQFSRYT